MKMKKMTGLALATAAAGMFAVMAAGPAAAQAAKVKCVGVNGCKGQGGCKGASNSCKGLNGCKGQGFVEMSEADCAKAKAAMKK
ncbi:MAG: BufA2 family periplasmic bufferin-type metallophore [Betaproteobacteria bacterium]